MCMLSNVADIYLKITVPFDATLHFFQPRQRQDHEQEDILSSHTGIFMKPLRFYLYVYSLFEIAHVNRELNQFK